MRKRLTGRGIAVTLLAALAIVAFAAIGDAATTDAAPTSSAAPTISGSPQQGSSLTASSGSWAGTTPIAFAFQWRLCDAGGAACADVTGATGQAYTVQAADVGKTLRVQVTATNSAGSGQATSDPTATVTTAPTTTGPQNTAAPAITGTTQDGQTLTVSNGTWTGTDPITYAYEWQRCDAQGQNCAPISGGTATTYMLGSADVGKKLQVLVTATNAAGHSSKYSNQVGAVAAKTTTTTTTTTTPPPKATSGTTIAASQVTLPNRLIVDRIQYPEGGRSRSAFTARYHVSDTQHRSVSGALVYTIGLPYGVIRTVPEQPTGADGWVTFTVNPGAKMPRRGYLVQFVRARTPQGDLLAGASTRRLVQVRVRP